MKKTLFIILSEVIMKAKCYLHLLLLTITAITFTESCSNKDEPEQEPYQLPYLRRETGVSANNTFQVSADQQTFSVKVLTNRAVRTVVSDNCTWIKQNDMIKHSGSDVVEFIYNIEANNSKEERIGYFSITPDDEESVAFNVPGIVFEIIQASD